MIIKILLLSTLALHDAYNRYVPIKMTDALDNRVASFSIEMDQQGHGHANSVTIQLIGQYLPKYLWFEKQPIPDDCVNDLKANRSCEAMAKRLIFNNPDIAQQVVGMGTE